MLRPCFQILNHTSWLQATHASSLCRHSKRKEEELFIFDDQTGSKPSKAAANPIQAAAREADEKEPRHGQQMVQFPGLNAPIPPCIMGKILFDAATCFGHVLCELRLFTMLDLHSTSMDMDCRCCTIGEASNDIDRAKGIIQYTEFSSRAHTRPWRQSLL